MAQMRGPHSGGSHFLQYVALGFVTALAVVVILSTAGEFAAQWQVYREAQRVSSTNAVVDDLLQAAQNLAFERGRTNVVLRGASPINAENRIFLDDRRRAAGLHMDRALEQLTHLDSPNLLRVRTAYGKVQTLRRDVDVSMDSIQEGRDRSLPDRWMGAASGLLRSVADLVLDVTLQRDGSTSQFRIFSRIKALAFQLRDDLGQESSRLASAISAGTAISPSALADIMVLRGRAQVTWAVLQREVGLTGSQPLAAAIQSVQTQFHDSFRPLEDQVLTAGQMGKPYPVSVKDYTGASVPALDSIAGLMAVATGETNAYAIANMRDARLEMIIQGVIVAVAVGFGGAAVVFVTLRLLLPLRRIRRDLLALAQGDTDLVPSQKPGRDEMGQMGQAVVILRDSLRQRQQVENDLRDRDELNKTLMNATSDAAFLLDRDGVIRAANQALADRFGRRVDDMIGQCFMDLLPDASHPQRVAAFQQVLQTGLPVHLRDERKGHILDNRVYPVLDHDGLVNQVAIFSRDVSDQVKAQDRLERTLKDLARSNQELEGFAYAASHDLRQPLRMISSFLSLAVRRLGDQVDAETNEFIGFAVDGANRLDRMITDLLEYARIGRDDQSRQAVSLAQAVGDARRSLQDVIADSGAQIVVPPTMPTVWGSASEMERLFQNLLSNALKFRALDRTPCIRISCQATDDGWLIGVADNGIGMAADEMGRLFTIFHRLVQRDQYDGNGIGLASCRKICDHHGGRIWAESVIGQGSTFWISLPRVPDII